MARVPTLIGIGGPFKGEVFQLDLFRSVVVGRSRQVDISIKRTAHYRAQTEAERDADTNAKTVSARHFQITFYNKDSLEIRNLSPNGTFLDGKPVAETAIINDIATRHHEIRFGADSRFKLAFCEAEESSDDPLPLE